MFPKEIKWFIQRGRRGYADCDIWEFHTYLSDVISGGLEKLSKEGIGCPESFYDEKNEDESFQKWKDELSYIAKGFSDYKDIVLKNSKLSEMVYSGHEMIFDEVGFHYEPEVPEWKYKKYDEFIKVEKKKFQEDIIPRFIKIYDNLWD
jgi:hypothetical protein